MTTSVHKKFLLEGLNCAHCATKIEDHAKKIHGILSVNINFASKVMSLDIFEENNNIDEILKEIKSIIKMYEPDVIAVEQSDEKKNKKTLYLKGLTCAHCAGKIEEEIVKIDGIENAIVDFANQKIIFEAKGDASVITKQVMRVALSNEPTIEFIDKSFNKNTDENKENKENKENIFLVTGLVLFSIAIFGFFNDNISTMLYVVTYLLVGHSVLLRAGKNILQGNIFDEYFLMSIATLGAFAIGQYSEGVAVMLFYKIGEFFQGKAVNNARKSVSSLMDIRPDFANVLINGKTMKVSPESVSVGDLIVVKPGERIPLDAVVEKGSSSLDVSALTGESLPKDVSAGDSVLSGSINQSGLLTLKVTHEFSESTVAKILDLIENSSSKKANTEKFITRFARYYTPFVVLSAVLLATLPPLFWADESFYEWIRRALVFLVVSCPCALVISVPLSFFGGIGGASKEGILIKGSNGLEALYNINTIVFDKTGTLTKGVFKVTAINVENGFQESEVLKFAAYTEYFSTHPISISIREKFNEKIDEENIISHEEIAGHGIKANILGNEVLVGNEKLLEDNKIVFNTAETIGTVVYVAIDGVYAGFIEVSDELKTDSKKAIADLKKIGVKNIVMLTGDTMKVAENIAEKIGLDKVYARLLPQDKVIKVEELEALKPEKSTLAFVGDGINDAPSLARADIGIAMGGVGSDAAIEAADVVLMNDELSKIVTAINIAKKTHKIVWQNIIFALLVKGLILILGAFGIATMWEAVFGDVGVTLIAVLNSMRAMKI